MHRLEPRNFKPGGLFFFFFNALGIRTLPSASILNVSTAGGGGVSSVTRMRLGGK
ncbi:hypothetical protein COCVIDRAFT_95937 [Bipolaris victoriae FI3]|uniref:Uncharacterized protein n=1 Tax=Bipolaris victoriae (strain FI3) TaxID=930091 RepID=W7EW78_BIPV3|nr:hypothetical protein COCVIDRAFT_95937 [Bipolaris victoriae FI3]